MKSFCLGAYREQIANFVVQNSHGGIYFPSVPMNFDPFTGSGAYVPTSSATAAAGMGGFGGSADPFTGGGAYVPGASAAAASNSLGGYSITGGGADPFTGAALESQVLTLCSGTVGVHVNTAMNGINSGPPGAKNEMALWRRCSRRYAPSCFSSPCAGIRLPGLRRGPQCGGS